MLTEPPWLWDGGRTPRSEESFFELGDADGTGGIPHPIIATVIAVLFA